MKRILLVFMLPVVLFLYSCEDDNVSGGNPPAVTGFPNSSGTTWEYRVVDSLSSRTDTMNIIVNGPGTISTGEEVTIWQLSYNSITDSNYVLMKGDTVKIFQDRDYLIDNIKLVFPLQIGKTWTGDFVSDSFYVAEKNTFTVPAGTFNSVYVIERVYSGFNEYKRMTIWFAENIGIIKLHTREVGVGFQNEVRELLSYQINE